MNILKQRNLLFIFFVFQNTFLFSQWETKLIKIPVIECSNQELASVLDTIIDEGKKCRDTLSLYIWIAKLKADTSVMSI